ncbi:MAG TPA: hypothetical protein VNI55_09875 [Gaiellaceae bacterium]|nr:hypothetical protein [Gaiellaceae bacterium]
MDDREAGTYSTPPEAAPPAQEARDAKHDMGRGLPVLFGAVFLAFVVVALIVFLIR